jgi:hypothetical protein
VSGTGHLIRFATGAITLSLVQVSGTGIKATQGTGALVLSSVSLASTGIIIKAGIELSLFNAFVSQLKTDIELARTIRTWVDHRKPWCFASADYPLVQIYYNGIIDEKFIAYPMFKMCTEEIVVKARCWQRDIDLIEIDKIRIGENIKDAIEKDVTINRTAAGTQIKSCTYRAISNYLVETTLVVHCISKKFRAEQRNALNVY